MKKAADWPPFALGAVSKRAVGYRDSRLRAPVISSSTPKYAVLSRTSGPLDILAIRRASRYNVIHGRAGWRLGLLTQGGKFYPARAG
jgi:hypothetical protein